MFTRQRLEDIINNGISETRCCITANFVCASLINNWSVSKMRRYKDIPDNEWYNSRWTTRRYYRFPADEDISYMQYILQQGSPLHVSLCFGNLAHQFVMLRVDGNEKDCDGLSDIEFVCLDSYISTRKLVMRNINPLYDLYQFGDLYEKSDKKAFVNLWNTLFECHEGYLSYIADADPPMSFTYAYINPTELQYPRGIGSHFNDDKLIMRRTHIVSEDDVNNDGAIGLTLSDNDSYMPKSSFYTKKLINVMMSLQPKGPKFSY